MEILIRKEAFSPYIPLALCKLAPCITQGAPLQLVDLLNTPYEGLMESEINDPSGIERALYIRAILIAPDQPTFKGQVCQVLKGILEKSHSPTEQPSLLYRFSSEGHMIREKIYQASLRSNHPLYPIHNAFLYKGDYQ